MNIVFKENKKYFFGILLVFVAIWLLKPAPVTYPYIEMEEKVELISFEQMKGVTESSKKYKGELYDFTDEIMYYPKRTKNRYEALIQLKYTKLFHAKQVLFLGNGNDFNLFIKELSFIQLRNEEEFGRGVKNFFKGAGSTVEGIVLSVNDILQEPYESAKQAVKAIANIPSKTWDIVRGEYNIEDIEKLFDAFMYNKMNELAIQNGLNYEKSYLQITKDEIKDATIEFIGGR